MPDNWFKTPGVHERFKTPGVDARFPSLGVDARFPSLGVDARFMDIGPPMIEGFMGYAGTTSNDSYGYATKGAMFQATTDLNITKIHAEFYAGGATYEAFVALISGFTDGVDTITSVVGRKGGLVAETGFAEIVLDTPAQVPAGAKFLVGITRTDSTATAHASIRRHSGDYTGQEFAIQAPVTLHGVRIQDTNIQGGETIGGTTSISAKVSFTAEYAEPQRADAAFMSSFTVYENPPGGAVAHMGSYTVYKSVA